MIGIRCLHCELLMLRSRNHFLCQHCNLAFPVRLLESPTAGDIWQCNPRNGHWFRTEDVVMGENVCHNCKRVICICRVRCRDEMHRVASGNTVGMPT